MVLQINMKIRLCEVLQLLIKMMKSAHRDDEKPQQGDGVQRYKWKNRLTHTNPD